MMKKPNCLEHDEANVYIPLLPLICVLFRSISMESFSLRNLSIDESQPVHDPLDPDNDPLSTYNRSPHVEPFHRQRRIDGTLSFNDQQLTMQHIVFTNGLDGRTTINDDLNAVDDHRGGVWKEILNSGIGQLPSTGASV